jgi:lipoprotein signal peptidase
LANADFLLKMWARKQPEEWVGFLYPCQHALPITLHYFIAIVLAAVFCIIVKVDKEHLFWHWLWIIGALSNLTERAIYGSVTDMIPIQLFGTKWVIFNLADVYLLGIFVTYKNIWKKT